MSQRFKAVFTAAHTHADVLEDGRAHPRTFAAGSHIVPAEVVDSARAAGVLESAEAVSSATAAPRKASRKAAPTPPAAKAPAKKSPRKR